MVRLGWMFTAHCSRVPFSPVFGQPLQSGQGYRTDKLFLISKVFGEDSTELVISCVFSLWGYNYYELREVSGLFFDMNYVSLLKNRDWKEICLLWVYSFVGFVLEPYGKKLNESELEKRLEKDQHMCASELFCFFGIFCQFALEC